MHLENWLYEKSDRSSHSPPTTWDYPQKPLQKAPAWPQKMLLRLQRWPSYSRNEPHCTWQTPFQEMNCHPIEWVGSPVSKSSGPSSRGNLQTPTTHASQKPPNLVNVMGPERMNTSPNHWQQSFKASLLTEPGTTTTVAVMALSG